MILVAAHNAAPTTCTPRDKQTRFSTRNKDKGKNRNVPDSNSNLAKSMTHHNQTKELIAWFLTYAIKSRVGVASHPLSLVVEKDIIGNGRTAR
jgi:hypothetical protein